jgi:hypothetical protein
MPLREDEISGGGAKPFVFENIGDACVGEILLIEKRQQRAFGTGEPMIWEDTREPRMLYYAEIQTDARDDDEDDGIRALYMKGGVNYEPKEGSGTSAGAALDKIMKDGNLDIAEGGQLAVAFTGMAKATTAGFQSAKLYAVQYKAPVSSISADDLFANGE